MSATHPIHIVGGGLAGLALGIGLRRAGVDAVLHEAHRYPRHRVCGEFIAGHDPGLARGLGIDDLLADARPLRRTAWFRRGHAVCERALPRPALGVSRYRLDQRLAARFIELGGELRAGHRVTDLTPRPGWVWANGPQPSGGDTWIGLKIHCRHMPLASDLELHLGDHAYAGASPVEDGRVNVCGLFRRRPTAPVPKPERLLAYLEASGLGALARRVRAGDPDPASATGVARLDYRASAFAPDTIRIGDQSGLVAPFTGNGMEQAFTSAALAAGPLIAYARGTCIWEAACVTTASAQRTALARRRGIARRLHPWLLHPAGQGILALTARAGLLPFGWLYQLTH